MKQLYVLRCGWLCACLLGGGSSGAVALPQQPPQTAPVETEVQGRVTDRTGQPVSGVSVKVKGTSRGTTTDSDGRYRLTVPGPAAVLVFSSVGFLPQELTVGSRTEVSLTLADDTQSLDEVVVVGYGTQKKRDLTGAVSQISTAKIEKENPNSVQDILRGAVAGLNVGIATSAKGGGSLLVRGRNSLNASTSPLLVVDGAIYYGELSDINPNDIETIDVLKDASSAAVFGAKAASGVILITTKKGVEGKPRIGINTNIGMASPGQRQAVLGPNEFVAWRADVMKNINASYQPHQFDDPSQLPADITLAQWLAYDGSKGDPTTIWLQRLGMQPAEIENYRAGKSTNWYDMVFVNGFRQDHTISISGRNSGTSYYMSLGYLDNKGIVYGDRFKTIRGRFNLESRATKFLTVGVNAQFADRDESQVPVDLTLARTLSPWGTPLDSLGNYVWRPNGEASGGKHPYYDRSFIDRRVKITTFNPILFAQLTLPLGFSFRVNYTPRYEFYERYNHESSKHAEWAAVGGNVSRQQAKTFYWQIDNILKWTRTFGVHNVDVTLLANAEKFQRWDNTMTNRGLLPTDVLGYHGVSTGVNPTVTSNDEYSTGDGLMGRLFYSFNDRYLLTLSTRRDGYSAFGQKNPRAWFSSAALGWVFTQEKFFQSNWLSFGKLRASWGSNGNRDIGRYLALSDLNTGKYLHVRPDGTVYQVNQLYVNRMQNANLRWERTTAINLGLDFGLFNNKISGSAEAYRSSTTDLLVERSLPDILGFSWVMDNLGEVQNRGLELTLNTVNFDRPNFSWRSTFNFQLNRNKIVHLYGDVDENGREIDDVANRWFIGHAIDEIWNFKVDGIWQQQEAAEAAKYGVRPGDFKIRDVNGDGKYTNDDKMFQGFSSPRFRWTFRNDITFLKNFDLSLSFYSYWGQKTSFNQMKNRDGFLDRTSSYVFPYWTAENPSNEWARLYSSEGGASGFSVYRDRSFIRFQNVALAYSVPQRLAEKLRAQGIKLFGSVQNVGYYAPHWDFWDAEANEPLPRIMTLGLDLTF